MKALEKGNNNKSIIDLDMDLNELVRELLVNQ